jgi:hypothetical protein
LKNDVYDSGDDDDDDDTENYKLLESRKLADYMRQL